MERSGLSKARLVSRRAVLGGGIAGAVFFGLGPSGDTSGGAAQPSGFAPPGPPQPLNAVAPPPDQNNVSVERVYSRAREQDVDIVTMYPNNVDRAGLPVCLMLHGRFGDARKSAWGLPIWLSTAVARGAVPPFAFLAVDGGGNSYWHYHPGDDPMWMLLDEVPMWLKERGLGGPDGQPFAVSGISMGGFGALLYARKRRERNSPVRAAAVVSPALITNWPEMDKRKAFTDEAEWAESDPLQHIDALGDVPTGVWCGTEDRFITGTRQFIKRARPEIASTSSGGHNSRYYRKALPEVISFVGRHVPDGG
jgi:S-formylglutathione hydrolase FrmB